MRILLLGRKPVACHALRYMISRGANVVAVVTPGKNVPDPYPERLVDVAESHDVPVLEDHHLYEGLASRSHRLGKELRDLDLVVSILHQKRIRLPVRELGRIACVNFHPAPLPEYRGWGTYNVAILESVTRWGAGAHFVDEHYDTGPLIRVRYFDVDANRETALSLQRKTQPVLLELFQEVFELACRQGSLPSKPQGPGRSFTKQAVLAKRFIRADDPPEVVDRKMRAFWYPPNPCAEVEIDGQHFPVINQAIFHELVPLVCREVSDPDIRTD